MLSRKVNPKVHLAAILVVASLISVIAVGAGKSMAAGTTTGTQTAPATQTSASTTAKTTPAQPQSSTAAQTQGANPVFNGTPDSIIQLIKNSDTAMDKKTDGKYGVHFNDNFTMSDEGVMLNSLADGDVLPPDKVKATIEEHLPYQESGADLFDAIIAGGNIYVKPAVSQKWVSAKLSDLSLFDDDVKNLDFTKYIVNPRYLGQETAPGGNQVYHIRVDIDAAKVTDDVEKYIKPNVSQEVRQEVDKMRTSTVSEDFWIGVSDLLLYQETARLVNTDLQISYDDMLMLNNWGEQIDISPPPAQDVISADDLVNSCTCSASSGQQT